MPVLTIDNKIFLTQSVAIARYLSKTFKLTGRDNLHDADLDAIVDHMQDLHWSEFLNNIINFIERIVLFD